VAAANFSFARSTTGPDRCRSRRASSTRGNGPWFRADAIPVGLVRRQLSCQPRAIPGHRRYLETQGRSPKAWISAARRASPLQHLWRRDDVESGPELFAYPDIRLRVTESRDIRAPNLNDLFCVGHQPHQHPDQSRQQHNIPVPGSHHRQPAAQAGNCAQLRYGRGVLARWIPGLDFSVDYYSIEIKGAIGSVTSQIIANRCFQGQSAYCNAITYGTSPDGSPRSSPRSACSRSTSRRSRRRGLTSRGPIPSTWRMSMRRSEDRCRFAPWRTD